MSQGQHPYLLAQALQPVAPNEFENQSKCDCHRRGPHMLVLVLLVGLGAQSSLERLTVHARNEHAMLVGNWMRGWLVH